MHVHEMHVLNIPEIILLVYYFPFHDNFTSKTLLITCN